MTKKRQGQTSLNEFKNKISRTWTFLRKIRILDYIILAKKLRENSNEQLLRQQFGFQWSETKWKTVRKLIKITKQKITESDKKKRKSSLSSWKFFPKKFLWSKARSDKKVSVLSTKRNLLSSKQFFAHRRFWETYHARIHSPEQN